MKKLFALLIVVLLVVPSLAFAEFQLGKEGCYEFEINGKVITINTTEPLTVSKTSLGFNPSTRAVEKKNLSEKGLAIYEMLMSDKADFENVSFVGISHRQLSAVVYPFPKNAAEEVLPKLLNLIEKTFCERNKDAKK